MGSSVLQLNNHPYSPNPFLQPKASGTLGGRVASAVCLTGLQKHIPVDPERAFAEFVLHVNLYRVKRHEHAEDQKIVVQLLSCV